MITLENEIASALTAGTITAAELATLVVRAQTAIVEAEVEAKLEEERIFDPQLCPGDPQAAKAAMENALLASGRLKTLTTRLTRKRAAVEAEERLRAWEAEFKQKKAERDALADELLALYPEVTARLIDLFTRIVVFDNKLHALHELRPSGVQAHLTGVELEARQLERFTRDEPPILKEVLLFNLASGKQSWPPLVKRDLSSFIPVIEDVGRNSEWWKPEIQEAKAAEAAREQARLAAFYERQKADREEREHAVAAK